MIKILYIVSSLKKSGPTIQLFNLTKRLNKNKFQPVILTLSKTDVESMKDQFVNKDIQVFQMDYRKIPINTKDVDKYIRNIKPDLIHTSGIRSDFLGSELKVNIPTVSTIHNYMFKDYIYRYGTVLGNIMVHSHLNFLKKLDHPVVCSESISKQYFQRINKKFDFITNGVDTDKFQPAENKITLQKKLKLEDDKVNIVSTGHLSELKDPTTICEAFVNSKIKNKSHLIFLGEGELKNSLQSKYKNENISFLGRVSNVNEYLQAADVFVSASHTEGMPNSVLEAMATNLPVILSNIPPHKEIIQYNKTIFKIFEVQNSTDLQIKFNELINRLNSKVNNREIVKKYFSDQVMTSNYEKVYLDILRTKI